MDRAGWEGEGKDEGVVGPRSEGGTLTGEAEHKGVFCWFFLLYSMLIKLSYRYSPGHRYVVLPPAAYLTAVTVPQALLSTAGPSIWILRSLLAVRASAALAFLCPRSPFPLRV